MDPKFPYRGQPDLSENIEVDVNGNMNNKIGGKRTKKRTRRRKHRSDGRPTAQPGEESPGARPTVVIPEDEPIPQVKKNNLQSVKPFCYNYVELNELQARDLISSFTYTMEINDASRLLACAYVSFIALSS